MKQPTNLHRAEYVWNTYAYRADASARLEDVTKPEFWSMVAEALREDDILEVISVTKEFEVRMRVLSVTKNEKGASEVKLRILDVWEPGSTTTVAPTGHLSVEFGGPKHRWRVIDASTKSVMSHGHATREEAEGAMSALFLQRAA